MRKHLTPLLVLAILGTCAEAQQFPFRRAKQMQQEARDMRDQSRTQQEATPDYSQPDPAQPPQAKTKSNPMVHKAAGSGQLNELQFLESKGNSLTASDADGNTPLHLAAYRGQTEVVEYLLSRPGLLKDPVDKRGYSPLMLAASAGHAQTLAALLAAGCDPNLKAQDGGTALHKAAAQGNLACVQKLLEAGCDPKVLDQRNKTAQQLAEEKKKSDWQLVVSALKTASDNP